MVAYALFVKLNIRVGRIRNAPCTNLITVCHICLVSCSFPVKVIRQVYLLNWWSRTKRKSLGDLFIKFEQFLVFFFPVVFLQDCFLAVSSHFLGFICVFYQIFNCRGNFSWVKRGPVNFNYFRQQSCSTYESRGVLQKSPAPYR